MVWCRTLFGGVMTPEPDVGLINKILGLLGAALGTLSLWAWNTTHKRIDEKVDKQTYDERGASNAEKFVYINKEMDLQRGHVAKIFDDISEFKKDTNHQFGCLTKQIDEKFITLLTAIHGIDKK